MNIRAAAAEDAASIQKIYAPYVEKTAVTFEYEAPGVDEIRRRIVHTLREYPYLVAVEQGEIVGYAYAGPFYPRAAYRHSAEVSIYLDAKQQKKGIGTRLYRELETRLLRQNVYVVYACIAASERGEDEHLTDASLCFHEKMGYTLAGKHRLCGYKFKKWYSVVWMEKSLSPRPEQPEAFIPFSELGR